MFYLIFFEGRVRISTILLLLAALYTIYSVKVFILQAYLPAVIIWVMMKKLGSINSVILRSMVAPFYCYCRADLRLFHNSEGWRK